MATNEATLNSILDRSFKRIEFHNKIQDAVGGKGLQRPFDCFGTYDGKPLYYETKLLKKYEAFSFSRIEDHQEANLKLIHKKLNVPNYTLIVLGIYIARKEFKVLFFDSEYIWKLKESGIKSIKKKELLELVDKNMFLEIKSEKEYNNKYVKYIQNLDKIKEVIIG